MSTQRDWWSGVHPAAKLMLGIGAVGAFVLLAGVVHPFGSRAEQVPAAALNPHAQTHGDLDSEQDPALADPPLIGSLIGRDYLVWIYSASDGPRYTVCEPDGFVLESMLRPDDVYRIFPDLDIQTMQFTPEGSGGEPLMMVIPDEE